MKLYFKVLIGVIIMIFGLFGAAWLMTVFEHNGNVWFASLISGLVVFCVGFIIAISRVSGE